VRQAVDLLPLWVDIDVDDALELLGKEFQNRAVRSYAVNQLKKADDDDLLLYLLQLVQALKFEHYNDKGMDNDSSLERFLISRSYSNPVLGNYFHWQVFINIVKSALIDLKLGMLWSNVRILQYTRCMPR
jgi:phosphatidylinositol 3-kinase